jgi:hypothetical protein
MSAIEQRELGEQTGNRIVVYLLGPTPAYLLNFDHILTPNDYVATINQLRNEDIIAVPANEGLSIAGFVFRRNQIDTLKALGHLAVGIPTEDAPSLLTHDERQKVFIYGCMPIIAAYRGIHQDTTSAWKITPKNAHSLMGHKGVSLMPIPFEMLSDFVYPVPEGLPKQVFFPFQEAQVQRVQIRNGLVVKIDTNSFGKAMEQSSPAQQANLLVSLIKDFNLFENTLGNITVLGERTSDSLIVYYESDEYSNLTYKIENCVAATGLSIKTVLRRIKSPVNLVTAAGRVIHSSQPISETMWAAGEKGVKRVIQDSDGDESVFLFDVH